MCLATAPAAFPSPATRLRLPGQLIIAIQLIVVIIAVLLIVVIIAVLLIVVTIAVRLIVVIIAVLPAGGWAARDRRHKHII